MMRPLLTIWDSLKTGRREGMATGLRPAGQGVRVVRPILTSLWSYVIAGLLAFYALLYAFLDLPSSLVDTRSVDPMRTLLGALATGLITAQALVFTISLVAAQLNARYTHRMVSRVFTWPRRSTWSCSSAAASIQSWFWPHSAPGQPTSLSGPLCFSLFTR